MQLYSAQTIQCLCPAIWFACCRRDIESGGFRLCPTASRGSAIPGPPCRAPCPYHARDISIQLKVASSTSAAAPWLDEPKSAKHCGPLAESSCCRRTALAAFVAYLASSRASTQLYYRVASAAT